MTSTLPAAADLRPIRRERPGAGESFAIRPVSLGNALETGEPVEFRVGVAPAGARRAPLRACPFIVGARFLRGGLDARNLRSNRWDGFRVQIDRPGTRPILWGFAL